MSGYDYKETLVSRLISHEEDFWLMFGDFLDDFYRLKTKKEKYAMICDNLPDESIYYSDWKDKAFIAASVNKLCNDSDMKSPDWVYDDEYCLKKPYFSMNTKSDLMVILLLESPKEFRMRNMYVEENVLSRV